MDDSPLPPPFKHGRERVISFTLGIIVALAVTYGTAATLYYLRWGWWFIPTILWVILIDLVGFLFSTTLIVLAFYGLDGNDDDNDGEDEPEPEPSPKNRIGKPLPGIVPTSSNPAERN